MLTDSALSACVTILMTLFLFVCSTRVANLRGKLGIKPPAMTGAHAFECAVRVHMNSLEQFAVTLPLLWIATSFFGGPIPAALGLLWVVGRIIYLVSYTTSPDKRGPGFLVGGLGTIGLFILSIWGIVEHGWNSAA